MTHGRIDDGFGEGFSWVDENRLLAAKEPLLQIMVSERTQDPDLREDVLQEGRIAVWQAMEKASAARHPDAYLHSAARNRMSHVLANNGGWTGHTGQHGKAVDPLRRPKDSLDDPDFAFEASAPEVLDSVMLGYHRGQIAQAIRALPIEHQEYVFLRFWGGWSNAQIAEHQDRNVGNMERTWSQAIRPRLRENLANLAGVL